MAQTDEEQHGPILFNIHVLLSAISMVSAMLLLALNRPISGQLLHGQPIPAPFLLAVYLVVNSPSMLTEYIYLIRNQPRRILLYAIITFSLQVVAVGLPPFLGFSVVHSIMGLLVVSGIRLVWLYSLLSQYKRLRFDLSLMKKIGTLSWPLVLATLLSSSAQYIDGFIVTAWFSPADFAVFSYGARELPLAILLANSLSMAMVPRFAGAKLDSPLAELRSEVYRLGIFLFPVTIIALLISHRAFPFVFSAEFEQSATIFNVYLMLLISRLLFPQTI
jgi:O-antigen/teichoic acid export membrane protein